MKPILFNTKMTLATLENRKTQTRRLVSPTPPADARLVMTPDKRNGWDESRELPGLGPDDRRVYYPRYYPGDILYVREAFMQKETVDHKPTYLYRVNPAFENVSFGSPWRPSIHMPKEAARIFLRVTDVRVERLQEITDKGARAEGCGDPYVIYYNGALTCEFAELWDSTIKPAKRELCGWAANPWVWVYEFERCEKPRTQ